MADYRLDVEAMQLGAADFLVKDQLTPTLLERSIRYAVAQARTLEELRRQQDELRASELRFRSVVQSAGDAILQADENARIIFWNKSAETVFGYREEEVLGFPVELLMPEWHRPSLRLEFERFRICGKSQLVGQTIERALMGLRPDADSSVEVRYRSVELDKRREELKALLADIERNTVDFATEAEMVQYFDNVLNSGEETAMKKLAETVRGKP